MHASISLFTSGFLFLLLLLHMSKGSGTNVSSLLPTLPCNKHSLSLPKMQPII